MSESRPGDRAEVSGDDPTLVFDDTVVDEAVVQESVDTTRTQPLTGPTGAPATDPDHRQRRWRAVVIGLVGAAVGFGLALLIVALAGNDAVGDEVTASEIEALESGLESRDARISELEAALDEARAASAGNDQDADARSRALDERAEVLEEWSADLSEREEDIARREADLDERERRLEQRERDEGGGDTGGQLVDDEVVDGIVQRVLERLRSLFE